MKKYYTTLLIFLLSFTSFIYSQNLNDILSFSANHNKNFEDLEKSTGSKSIDKGSKFGLESRLYRLKKFKILVESDNDEGKISKFTILTDKNSENHELWYSVTKEASENKDFTFIQSFVSNKDDIYKKDIPFKELVQILRNAKQTDELMYILVLKKENLFYHFNIMDNTFFITISSEYQNREL